MDTIVTSWTVPQTTAIIVAFVLGICLAVIMNQIILRKKAKALKMEIGLQIEATKREAENIIKSAQIDAATETIKKKEQFTAEVNQVPRRTKGYRT